MKAEKGKAMSTISDRIGRRMGERRNLRKPSIGSVRAVHVGTENRTRPLDPTPRRGALTEREVLIGLGIAVAWGLFLWLVIGGSIAAFGNPWPHS
jgi:hypothetical protein